MKKFLTRALPLCLALLIFVGSLAVPAFAAETDTVTISGTWVFTDYLDTSDLEDIICIFFDFYYNDVLYARLELWDDITCMDSAEDKWDFLVQEGEPIDAAITIVGSATLSRYEYDALCSVAYCADNTPLEVVSGDGPGIFSVFSGISGWIVSSIGTIMPMFYTEATGLTFIGTLAVAALALGVCFLIFALIRRFLNFG